MENDVLPIIHDELLPGPELIIRPSSVDEGYNRIVRTIRNLEYYKNNAYKPNLPDHPIFQKFTQPDADISSLYSEETKQIFVNEIYDTDSYRDMTERIENSRPTIEKALKRFLSLKEKWGFETHPSYQIVLTNFGVSGSYNSQEGIIIISTKSKGPPSNIIIHEGIHIGIEENIVDKYDLTHWEKERVVDKICDLQFSDLLQDYWFQPKADRNVDSYITSETIDQLPKAIEKFINDFPRPEPESI